jgi:hypothetical protein
VLLHVQPTVQRILSIFLLQKDVEAVQVEGRACSSHQHVGQFGEPRALAGTRPQEGRRHVARSCCRELDVAEGVRRCAKCSLLSVAIEQQLE